jgi:hypothetical protein
MGVMMLQTPMYAQIQTVGSLVLSFILLTVVMVGFMEWRRYQRQREFRDAEDRELAEKRRQEDFERAERAAEQQRDLELRRASLESERIAVDRELADRNARAQREAADRAAAIQREVAAASNSGAGSGGFIIIDMPEKDRSLFHDLLKAFEDYARLKGYSIAFSIDATFVDRIAFKFTVKDEGFAVGPDMVRRDLKEFLQHFRDGDFEDLEDLSGGFPTPESKHLLGILKDHMQYLKARYAISQKTVKQYQNFFDSLGAFPALSAPSVIVQTGGSMETRHQLDSRSYTAKNSRNIVQGDQNALTDRSIKIGKSFNEKNEQIAALDDVIAKLRTADERAVLANAERNLEKVRAELASEAEPDESLMLNWLETAKNVMASVVLGYELAEAGAHLWRLFGL